MMGFTIRRAAGPITSLGGAKTSDLRVWMRQGPAILALPSRCINIFTLVLMAPISLIQRDIGPLAIRLWLLLFRPILGFSMVRSRSRPRRLLKACCPDGERVE